MVINIHCKSDLIVRPILYYCYTSPIDNEFSKRITSQQLFNNIVDQIGKDYPSIISEHEEKRFSAAESRLMNLLKDSGEHGKKSGKVIPVIIDGLDHVARANPLHILNEDSKNIINFLSQIRIPRENIT